MIHETSVTSESIRVHKFSSFEKAALHCIGVGVGGWVVHSPDFYDL